MPESRYALLIGNSVYPKDEVLTDLRCPGRDVDGLQRVLTSAQIAFTEVKVLKDLPHYDALKEINLILKKAKKADLVLLYFSGHGKLDPANRLHLCAVNTEIAALESTAIPVESIKNFIDIAQTRKVGLILDCCFSGAVGGVFAKGGVDDQLQRMSGGRGVYVIAASTAIQAAVEKEGDEFSVFTKHLIDGLETGGADTDSDGKVTLDEVYEYVHKKVLDEGSQQPMKWTVNVEGEMVLATAAGPVGRTKRLKIREKLLALASQNVLPDKLLAEAMAHINATQSQGNRDLDKLLEDLSNDVITVGEFIGEWMKRRKSTEEISRAREMFREAAQEREKTERKLQSDRRGSARREETATKEQLENQRVGRHGWLVRNKLWLGGSVTAATLTIAVVLSQSGSSSDFTDNGGFSSSTSTEAPFMVDFEGASLPATFLGDWTAVSDEALGSWSLASATIIDAQSSAFSLTPPAGVSSVSFQFLSDSEECCDNLTVLVNGIEQMPAGLYSEAGWGSMQYRFLPLPPLSTITWRFSKDGSETEGRDKVWVDNITFGFGVDDFENGMIPGGYDSQWQIVAGGAGGSLASLASPPIGDSASAYFQINIPSGANGVTFDFKTDTEEPYDVLNVLVDEIKQPPGDMVSSRQWMSQTVALRPGDMFVRWEYRKDDSNTAGEDRVWVDNVRFIFP